MSIEKEILGLWSVAEGFTEEAGSLMVLFLANGKLVWIETAASDPPNGIEFGSYSITSDGDITYTIEYDAIKSAWDGGISDVPERIIRINSLTADKASFAIATESHVPFNKVSLNASQGTLQGVWQLVSQTVGDEYQVKGDAYLVFSNEKFWVFDTSEAPKAGYFDGLEYGTYSFDESSKVVTIEVEYNGTTIPGSDVGLSNRGPRFLVENLESDSFVGQFSGDQKLTLDFKKMMSDSSESKNSQQQALQGIWKSEGVLGEKGVYDEELIFWGDKFISWNRDPGAPPVGVEFGTFSLNSDGTINFDLAFDGLWRSNGRRDGLDNTDSLREVALSLAENNTQLTLFGDASFSKIALPDDERSLVGLWVLEQDSSVASGEALYVVFLADGTFIAAAPKAQTSYSSYNGLEWGTYAFSADSGQLSVKLEYDGAIDSGRDTGFSVLGTDFAVKLSSGEVTLINQADGDEISLTRAFGEPSDSSDETVTTALDNGVYSLTIIAELLGQVFVLQGLTETVQGESHTIEFEGSIYQYDEVDPFILTVARDEEFTEEFSQEIAESFPSEAEISYGLAISLIGQTNWHATLLSVAGADGSYLN